MSNPARIRKPRSECVAQFLTPTSGMFSFPLLQNDVPKVDPLQGIIPTAIVLLVHLDMVPGTRMSETYARTAMSELQWAAVSDNFGPASISGLSTTAFPSSQEESQIPTPTESKDEKALNITVALP